MFHAHTIVPHHLRFVFYGLGFPQSTEVEKILYSVMIHLRDEREKERAGVGWDEKSELLLE